MTNIFEGLNKISDEAIITQVALLELIKSNFSIPILDKANQNVHKLTKFFGNFARNSSKEDVENQKIYDFLENIKKENKELSRLELVTKLTELIKQKVGFLELDNPSLDFLSVRVIDEVAGFFNIPLQELPSVKAERISEITYEYIIENTENFKSEKHSISSKNIFNNTFKNFGENAKDKLTELLKVEEQVMILPSYRRSRGNSKIDKEILAIIVFASVMSLGGSLINQSDVVLDNDVTDEEVKYNKLVRKSKNSAFIKAGNTKKIISLETLLNEKKLKSEKEINKNKDSKIKISELSELKLKLEENLEIVIKNVSLKEKELSKYSNGLDEVKTMKYQKALFDSNQEKEQLLTIIKTTSNSLLYQEKVLERTNISAENNKNEIKDLEDKISELKIENNSIENTKDEVKRKLSEEGIKRKTKIIKAWQEYFNNFTIDNNVYEQVVEFDYKEVKSIELSLFELYDTTDLLALKQGLTVENYNYMIVNSLNRNPFKIIYEISNDVSKKGRIIGIERVPLY